MQLIYLAPLPWHSFTQRPHKFVEWFHQTFNGNVLWVDPYPTRLPQCKDFNRVSQSPDKLVREIPDWLDVMSIPALPLEPICGGEGINSLLWKKSLHKAMEFSAITKTVLVCGKPSRFALSLKKKSALFCVYDMMDDFPEFYSGVSKRALIRTEALLVEAVDQLVVSSQKLNKKWIDKKPKLIIVKNGLDAEFLKNHIKLHNASPPVLGYLGTVGEWFDWHLVNRIAEAFPSFDVRIIGPIYKQPPKVLAPNIKLFPACSHQQAIVEMNKFSVALIPFLNTPLTEGVDPIKFYEYHALGLPVVSTLFGEMHLHRAEPSVFLVEEGVPLKIVIEQALVYCPDDAEIENFIESNNWASRFSALTTIFN